MQVRKYPDTILQIQEYQASATLDGESKCYTQQTASMFQHRASLLTYYLCVHERTIIVYHVQKKIL